MHEAVNHEQVDALIDAALSDFPRNTLLLRAKEGVLSSVDGPIIGQDIPWRVDTPPEALEKLMEAESTILPISFLEEGIRCSRPVVMIRLEDGSTGSGFLTARNLIVTNHHVLPDERTAQRATVIFNYQTDGRNRVLRAINFGLQPDDGFATSPIDQHDWTFVRVKGNANRDWGELPLHRIDLTKTAWVNIIQHPGGGLKSIALYHNRIMYFDDDRVQYLTDTLPGSSGAPVFDSNWRVVALHHSGGSVVEPATRQQVWRNEGIPVNRLVENLERLRL